MKRVFADRLATLCEGRSVTECAKLWGLNQASLDRYLKQQRTPTGEAVASICKATGISADWLLGLSDTRAPVPVAPITATNSAVNTNGSTRIHVTQAEERLLAIIESQQATIHKLVH